MTVIFAHRGVHNLDPENSMASFKEAISIGIEGIETDVHLTKDFVPVIMHDESLQRMTGDERYIKDLTLSQLKELRLNNSNEQIPTLIEFLAFLKESNFQGVLNLEVKTDKIHYPRIEEITVELIKEYSGNYRVIFSSFYPPSVVKLHDISDFECALLFKCSDRKAKDLYRKGIIQSFHPMYLYVYLNSSIPIRPWTINNSRQLQKCFLNGIEGVFTDEPQLAAKIKKEIQLLDN
ncbi:glycerophosphodiester phosphodiesterase family protein [Xylocopilactobacillus apis]|uniref:Glycerophosphoryl diester phosphodiesterase n=1 Tax=Xylocopilactobacillus apis TaxID=2932183 RepID=A0AAU9CXM1_9LACO|nr:glycerophosphodiester phosphodiesterase family protein [Xylocopilactobacillus apis]BDR56124.1 glycerophosphoryl diester phosphodiesterase [Xylocopilactobacillus apis]